MTALDGIGRCAICGQIATLEHAMTGACLGDAPPATPPPTDDGGAAFAEKVDALIAAVGGEYPSDAETSARAALLAAHAAAVAAAEARGRAAVDAAIVALASGAWNRSVSVFGGDGRWMAGSSLTKATDDLYRPTPAAAILAAAATLAPATQEADDDDA